MKIDQMDLRQIDVLIAEWIGCKVVDPGSAIPRCECHHHPHSLELSPNLKPYSEDMLYAMEVVEKMRADGFSWKAWQPALSEHGQALTDGGAIVSFVCNFGPCKTHGNPHCSYHGGIDVQAETLPLAICKAALIALGKEQEQGKV